MNIFARGLARLRNLAARGRVSGERGFYFGRTHSGAVVNEDTALTQATVWACVRIISSSLAALPLHVHERQGRTRTERNDHPVDWLLSTQPNPEMAAVNFRETLIAHLLTWGNAYAEIQRDLAGRVLWLWPITPDRVRPERDSTGSIVYRVHNEGAAESVIAAANMLHVRGLGFDGLVGYSPVRMAMQAIGLGLTMEQFGGSFFANGANVGMVLEYPGQLSEAAFEHLKTSLAEQHAGASRAHKPYIIEEGGKINRVGIPPNEAQFLESRAFQRREICAWFGVQPHKVADLEFATFSNIEHQSIEFVTETLMPWAVRIEQEINLKLFGRINRGTLYVKHNFAALLRGDVKSRFDAYAIARQWGWMSANDVRSLEELNPMPAGGDDYLAPVNMVPADMLRETVEARAAAPQTAPRTALPADDADPETPDDVETDASDPSAATRAKIRAARQRLQLIQGGDGA